MVFQTFETNELNYGYEDLLIARIYLQQKG